MTVALIPGPGFLFCYRNFVTSCRTCRAIITRLLMPDFEVIGYVERGDELAANAMRLHPDIVTLDVAMPGQSGLNALPALGWR